MYVQGNIYLNPVNPEAKFIMKVLKMRMTNWLIFMVDHLDPSLSFRYNDL